MKLNKKRKDLLRRLLLYIYNKKGKVSLEKILRYFTKSESDYIDRELLYYAANIHGFLYEDESGDNDDFMNDFIYTLTGKGILYMKMLEKKSKNK